MSHPLRIAVADDDPDMQEYYRTTLARLGHVVVAVAETGRQLVEDCRRQQPDLLITDIKMPDMDGLDAVAEICRDGPVPVILATGYVDPEFIARAEEENILAYLVKPFEQASLEAAIALAMGNFERFQELRREASDLRQAMLDRHLIERAKLVLMRVAGLDEQVAYRKLQRLASDRNQKLVQIAHAILTAEEAYSESRPDGIPGAHPPHPPRLV